jgi:ABC-type sugar transport system ATPase subunit
MNTSTLDPSASESAATETAIELVEVSKRYSAGSSALQQISLNIHSGEFLVFLGPSGCGKSTILKIIAGLEDATEGEVYINGRLANYIAPKERDVAMVFQNYALYPHMTVEQNIGFPLRMRRAPKAETRKRVQEVAGVLDLDQMLGKYPDQLSGGQRQRVALGRALIRNPIAFLLDEPLSNLDALLRVQMRDELIKFHRQIKRTVVYVTHDQVEAMTMAHRIVVMRQGAIQQVGTPREVFNRPANTFVATFVGTPQMNLMPGSLEDSPETVMFTGIFRLPLGRRFPLPDNRQNVTLGIRPEDISLVSESESGGLPGRVTLVEPIGSDTYVSVETERDITIKARVPASTELQEGDRLRVIVAPEKVHLFDAQGARIRASDGESG